MKKTLAIATLALGLFAFGCDDDEDGGKADAATDAATNKPDATSDASAPDAKVDVVVTADGGVPGADADPDASHSDAGADWTTCANPKVAVSAADFCLQYMKECTFDTTGGTATMERYKSFSACLMEYTALTAPKQGCVAYHLCVASTPGNEVLHCPHPPQASLATPTGPCATAN
jgi:hypothetical protein